MADSTVADKVIALVAQVTKTDAGSITRESTFGVDIAAKSIHILQLVALLSNAFGVQVTMVEARKNSTVGDVIDMIEAKLA